jgi:hypothetical protein
MNLPTLNSDELTTLMHNMCLDTAYQLAVGGSGSICTIDGMFITQRDKKYFIMLNTGIQLKGDIRANLIMNTVVLKGIVGPTEERGQKVFVIHSIENKTK